jgi:hypothetical protein
VITYCCQWETERVTSELNAAINSLKNNPEKSETFKQLEIEVGKLKIELETKQQELLGVQDKSEGLRVLAKKYKAASTWRWMENVIGCGCFLDSRFTTTGRWDQETVQRKCRGEHEYSMLHRVSLQPWMRLG